MTFSHHVVRYTAGKKREKKIHKIQAHIHTTYKLLIKLELIKQSEKKSSIYFYLPTRVPHPANSLNVENC